MTTIQGFKSDALAKAFAAAIGGRTQPLFLELARVSGLPGTRINVAVAQALADECGRLGKKADPLIDALVAEDADRAPGGTPLEFLPVCGVYALGARMAADPKRRSHGLAVLSDAAEDLRFRVRDAVPVALARVGAQGGDAFLEELEPWMDGYFQAAAVLFAISRPEWGRLLSEPGPASLRLGEALALLYHASRADRRYPGFKALGDAVVAAAGPLTARLGGPILEVLEPWAKKDDPWLRDLVVQSMQNTMIRARHGDEVTAIEAAAAAAKPVPRDGKKVDLPTRKRGKKKRR